MSRSARLERSERRSRSPLAQMRAPPTCRATEPNAGSGRRRVGPMVTAQPIHCADGYPAVLLSSELGQCQQQRDLDGPSGQCCLVRRIDDSPPTAGGSEQNRFKDGPRLPVKIFQPAAVTGHADAVQDNRQSFCRASIGSPAVFPHGAASTECLPDLPADDVFSAGLTGSAAEHTRRSRPHRRHAKV